MRKVRNVLLALVGLVALALAGWFVFVSTRVGDAAAPVATVWTDSIRILAPAAAAQIGDSGFRLCTGADSLSCALDSVRESSFRTLGPSERPSIELFAPSIDARPPKLDLR